MSELDEFLGLYNRGAFREAYVFLCHIMAAQPHLRKVGDIYVIRASLELTVNDDVSQARELLDTSLQLGCRDMAAYYRAHGFVLWRLGERERGIGELYKSVELDPNSANLATLGKVLSCEADERGADIWTQVLERDPLSCQAHIYLGILAAKTGKKETALFMAKTAETLHPTSHNVEEIARLYAEAGEIRLALDTYLQADRLGLEPKGPLYANIAVCHFELGNIPDGCTYLEQARRCNPNSADVKEMWDLYKDKCNTGL